MDGGRKILWGDYQSSLLTSICDNGGYMKHIQKHTRIKMVLVSIVSILCSKNSRRKTVGIRMKEEKYYGEIAKHQYYTQQQKKTKGGNGSKT